jgi:hypothetical protein
MNVTQEEVNAACRLSFDAFAQRAFRIVEPGTSYEWNWHIGCIADHLEAVYAGDIQRLIINIPPRTLKSYLVSVAFPAWILGKHPHERFIMTSHNFRLARSMVMKTRRIIEDEWYQQCFKGVEFSSDQNEKHHFETTRNGMYYAGALSSVTGTGASYVLCDDPVNPTEALSDTIRENANTEIRSTLFSRFNDKRTGKFILVMQRLHEDDPTGNLLRDGGYTILKLPAEAKRPVLITLGKKVWTMKEEQLLFPDRLTKKILEETRRDLLDYNYVGQYLQEPVALGGGEFKEEWIQYYQSGGVKPTTMNVYILVDPSGGEEVNRKKKKASDWTAMMVVGLAPDNNYYLLDIIRDRLNPTERIDKLFELHRKWNGLCGKPPTVGYEKYGLMTDTHYIREKQNKDAYRFGLIELGGSMEKTERIRRMIPDLQNRRWWYPANLMYTDGEGRTFDLVRELVRSEMPTFPRARFDDMLDALSRIYDEDMNAMFPKVQKTSSQKMISAAYPAQTESWLGY